MPDTSGTTPSLPFFGSRSSGNDEMKTKEEDKNCQQCMDHLTSILTSIQSKPKILFEAMGVAIPTESLGSKNKLSNDGTSSASQALNAELPEDANSKNINLFWTIDKDGKGLRMLIPKEYSYKQSTRNEKSQDSPKLLDNRNRNVGFGGASTVNQKGKEACNRNSTMIQRVRTKLRETFANTTSPSSINLKSKANETLSPPASQLATSSVKNQPLHNRDKDDSLDSHMTLEIQCRECGTEGPEGSARAYLKGPTPLTIILCTNRLSLSSSDEIDEVLTHELIHVYDVHHRKWDLSNCQTLAKSEIRAAREAECSSVFKFGLFWRENCVKEKAKDATKNMFPYHGYDCVNQVFKDAMKDRTPFDENDKHQNFVKKDSKVSRTIATSVKNEREKR